MRRFVVLAAAFALSLQLGAVAAEPVVHAPPVVSGRQPMLQVRGLTPGGAVRVHTLRRFSRWVEEGPRNWVERPQLMHAWADFRANAQGVVDPAVQRPSAGTFRAIDPSGLLWSGRRQGDAALAAVAGPAFYANLELADGETLVRVTRGAEQVAEGRLTFVDPPDILVGSVARPGLNGIFAAPRAGRRLPTVVLLHGSEGGSASSARNLAVRFAGQGFAALAVNYFAWDLSNLSDVPNVHVNTPIEGLERARDFLATRAEADVERLGVYGHSKGAEFGLVAAVRYPWIDAVAACVPTDVVWEGYGIGDERNRTTIARPAQVSSWSFAGEPLPYVPLRAVVPGVYAINTERYERSRGDDPARAAAAAIPIEQARASFLLLSGERDEVWASGPMTLRLAGRMQRAGRAADIEAHVYRGAGHGICGDGTYPPRVWGEEVSTDDPRWRDLDAEGAASADGWHRIIAFFNTRLRGAGPSS